MTSPILDCAPFREQLLGMASALPEVPRADLYGFLGTAKQLSGGLPEELSKGLDEFNVNGNQDGYLLLTGLPVESEAELPPTPTSAPTPEDRRLLNMEAMLAVVGGGWGCSPAMTRDTGTVVPARSSTSCTRHPTRIPCQEGPPRRNWSFTRT